MRRTGARPRQRALRNRCVGDALRPESRRAIAPHATFEEVTRTFAESRDLRLYVAGDRLEGAIDLHDVKTLLGERGLGLPVIAGEIARKVEPLSPDDTLELALARLEVDSAGELSVCDPATGRFLGVLTRLDVEDAVRQAL